MKQWLLGLLILLAAIAGSWYLLQPAEETADDQQAGRSSNVNVVQPRQGEIEDRLEAVGSTSARNSVDIASEVDGRIVELHFSEGQAVEQNQVLVTFDQRQARADLQVAEARLTDAQAKYDRATLLQNSQSIAAATVDELRASLAIARANIQAARTRLDNLQITAPFDGVVGLRDVSVGAYLNAGDTITTLDSLAQMQMRFDVPQRFISQLQLGQEVEIGAGASAGAGERFNGEITELGSRVDPLSRTLTAQARIENPDGRIRPGQFLNVSVTLRSRSALLIPEQAVLTRGRDKFVFIDEDGQARRRALTLGSRQAGQVEVIEGLESADRVIITGQDNLDDGDRLRILEDDDALLSRGATANEGDGI